MTSKTILFCCVFITAITAISAADLVTFPYKDNPCSCVLVTCTCCTGVKVAAVGFSKNVCVVLKLSILSLSIDVTIKLDSKVLSQFSFSAKNPPTYCIPITLPVAVSMCLKVHDMKLIGLTAIQMCMTIYASVGGQNVATIPLNCVKMSSGSMTFVTTAAPTTG